MSSVDDVADSFALAPADLRHVDIPATADQLLPLRHDLARWAAATGLGPELVDAVILAGDEAMSNVVSHAYAAGPVGTFDLLASYEAAEGTVVVVVRDRGAWQPEVADPGPLHGRGLVLIRALAHRVTFEREDEGTTVRMVWVVPGRSE